MNVLDLSLVPDRIRMGDFAVEVRIDGEPLTERVRKIEAHHRQALGGDPMVCRYTWVCAKVMLLPGLHLMGVPASPWCPGYSELLCALAGKRRAGQSRCQ